METYEELVESGKRAANMQWTLGDLAAQVETHYAEHSLEDYADDIGVNYNTLLNYRTVVKAYPEKSCRQEVSFTIAQVLAAQDDRAELVKTIKTVREARDFVYKQNHPEPKPTPPRPDPKPTTAGPEQPRPNPKPTTAGPEQPKTHPKDKPEYRQTPEPEKNYKAMYEAERRENAKLLLVIAELKKEYERLLRIRKVHNDSGLLNDVLLKLAEKAISTDNENEANTALHIARERYQKARAAERLINR